MIQMEVAAVVSSSVAIVGRATLAIVLSSTAMDMASQMAMTDQ